MHPPPSTSRTGLSNILIESPSHMESTSYVTGQRLYVDLLLPPGHPVKTTTACVYIDLFERPSWCGEVTQKGSETMYLTPKQTRSLGRGPHAITVNKETAVIFNLAEPRAEVMDVKLGGEGTVLVIVALMDYDGRSPWEVCLLVDSVPACTSLGGEWREREEVVLELQNVCFEKWGSGGDGWEVKVTPMVLDTNSTKALWLGKDVSVRSRSPSPPTCRVFDLKFAHQAVEEARLGKLGCSEANGPTCYFKAMEWGLYSQNGEDGILLFVLRRLMGLRRFEGLSYFEFGAENGAEVNTRLLRERHGTRGLLVDSDYENFDINLRKSFVTVGNIGDIMRKWIQRREYVWSDGGGGGLVEKITVDIISLDMDRNDYWVLKEMLEGGILKVEDVKVVIIEYNSHITPKEGAISVPYAPMVKWDGKTSYFGASLTAFADLLAPYGLVLYYCESHGVNAFFLNERHMGGWQGGPGGGVKELWKGPNFYGKGWRYPAREEREDWIDV